MYGASPSISLSLSRPSQQSCKNQSVQLLFLPLGDAGNERMAQRHVGTLEPTHHPCDISSRLKCNRHTKQRRGK